MQKVSKNTAKCCVFCLVRAKGIEPSPSAWEASVLPLYYARDNSDDFITGNIKSPEFI